MSGAVGSGARLGPAHDGEEGYDHQS
eukprot:SAG22_NODE_3981_length_1440_cov_1.340045_1_plen_25_part_10